MNFLERDGHSQNPFVRKGFQLSYYRLNHIKLQNSRPFFPLELPKGEAKKNSASLLDHKRQTFRSH